MLFLFLRRGLFFRTSFFGRGFLCSRLFLFSCHGRLPSTFVYDERRVNLYLKNQILPPYGLFGSNALLYLACQYFFAAAVHHSVL